jgi:hypothetical protein
VNEEGWYIDPFGRHEARWISNGTPTELVRDGAVESQDPPPPASVEGELQRVSESPQADGGDLKRADDAETEDLDPNALTDRASTAIDGIASF